MDSHIRINLEMLCTRHRETLLVSVCLEVKQPLVVENTNLTVADDARYIAPARASGFRVVGYRFRVTLEEAIARNAARSDRWQIPEQALRGAKRIWQPPAWGEGFDALFDVPSRDGALVVRGVNRA